MTKQSDILETAENLSSSSLLNLYTIMLRIRKFEEKVTELLRIDGEIICPVHLYTGQEAVSTGVCANLRKDDYVFSTHRSHGHYLAKGGDMRSLMAELYGRATGCSRGRGGSMHLAAPEFGLPGSSAIVAGTISLAVGTALAFSLQKQDAVSVAFFGDGATNEGIFYESLNLASLRKLPVVFVCENNLYSTHLPISECLGDVDISKKARAFGVPAQKVDGNDVEEVFHQSKIAVDDARSGGGPVFLECMTYRWLGHVGPNDDLEKGLRSKDEVDYWKNKCPVEQMEQKMIEQGIIGNAELTSIGKAVEAEVEEALTFAKQSPYPDKVELMNNVFKL